MMILAVMMMMMMEALSADTLLSVVIHRKRVSQNSKKATAGTITVFIVSNSEGFKQIQKSNLSNFTYGTYPDHFSNLHTYIPSPK